MPDRRFARLAFWVIAATACGPAAAQNLEARPERQLLTTEAADVEQRIADRKKTFCDQKLREAPRGLRLEIPSWNDSRAAAPIPAKELDGIFCFSYRRTTEALARGDIKAAREAAHFNIMSLPATNLCPTESAFLSYQAAVRAYVGLEDAYAALLNLMLAYCSNHIQMHNAPIENAAIVAQAAAFALDRRHTYKLPVQVTDRVSGQLAYILISLSVGQREKWASSFISYYRERPEVLAEQGFSTEQREQMVAVATGLSGDWAKALTLYRSIAARPSADHEWLSPAPRSHGGDGLLNIITWPGRIRDETLTALAMAGHAELASCLLDHPQLAVAATDCDSTSAHDRRPDQATIRVLTTNLGTLIIGRRSGAAEPVLVQLYPSLSSIKVISRVDGSSQLRVLGLVQMFHVAAQMDLGDDRRLSQMKLLFNSAANVAEELAGGPIRSMLARLRVPEGGEVAIVTTGAVALLPIAAAKGPGGTPLGSRYAIGLSILPSSQTHAEAIQLPTSIRVSGGSTDLPNTAMELRNVRFWSKSAEPPFSSLEEIGRGRPPRILHISNHAGYRPDIKGASAIELSGGTALTIADVERWRPKAPPRLVVLSGCQTGLLEFSSSVREQRSLARAFLLAGAKGVVASTWPVDDLATALLMSKFYDELAAGKPPLRALYGAQRWIAAATGHEIGEFVQDRIRAGKMNARDTGDALALVPFDPQGQPFADPVYWAGFQFFGS